MELSKGWQKVLIGVGILATSPVLVVCVPEIVLGVTVASAVAAVGTALVERGAEEILEE